MMKEKNLDDLFREKLLNYEQEPPAYLLENILDGVTQNRRKKRLIWLRISGVAAALLLAFIAGWQFSNNDNLKMAETLPLKTNVEKNIPGNTTPELKLPETVASVKNEKPGAFVQNIQSSENKVASEETQFDETAKSKKGNKNLEQKDDNYLIIRSLNGLLQKAENTMGLREKKQIAQAKITGEKSIDQQIMEMNRQMLAVNSKNNTKAKWSLGAEISPEYNGSYSAHSQAYASNMLKTQSNTIDLAGGISVEYKKGKRWSLQSGVYYSGMGQTSGNNNYSKNLAFADAPGSNYLNNATIKADSNPNHYTINSRAGVVELNSIPAGMVLSASSDERNYLSDAVVVSQNTFIQDFDFVEIPLYLRYNLVDNRFGISMLGGISSNILVGNRLYVDGNLGRSLVGRTKDMETFNYSGTIGMGLKYGLTNRLSVNVEPRFKYFINSLNRNSSVTYKPYTFGVYTGLSYEF